MKPRSLGLMAAIVLVLASCSTPAAYEYEYQIINTRRACEPDYETWVQLYSVYTYPEGVMEQSEIEAAAAAASKIVTCTAGAVQGVIRERGAEGWRLVAFEALQPGAYDLGVEYIYRLVWERPQ
jgi:hypothetical protein